MKVSIYNRPDEGVSVLLEAAPGSGLAPMLYQDVAPSEVRFVVASAIAEMKRAKALRRAPRS